MDLRFLDRVNTAGNSIPLTQCEFEGALQQGKALHCDFCPNIKSNYLRHLEQMAAEGAHIIQLVDQNEVRSLGVWRSFLTTYCGRRFEIDDLVTADAHRSKGYGATMIKALEAKARALSCDTMMLASATRRVDALRFYFRERYVIDAFLFRKTLEAGA